MANVKVNIETDELFPIYYLNMSTPDMYDTNVDIDELVYGRYITAMKSFRDSQNEIRTIFKKARGEFDDGFEEAVMSQGSVSNIMKIANRFSTKHQGSSNSIKVANKFIRKAGNDLSFTNVFNILAKTCSQFNRKYPQNIPANNISNEYNAFYSVVVNLKNNLTSDGADAFQEPAEAQYYLNQSESLQWNLDNIDTILASIRKIMNNKNYAQFEAARMSLWKLKEKMYQVVEANGDNTDDDLASPSKGAAKAQ